MSETEAFFAAIREEHGECVLIETPHQSERIYQSGLIVLGDNTGSFFPQYFERDSLAARKQQERFFCIRIQQAKAKRDAAIKALEDDIAGYVETGIAVEDIDLRQSEIAQLDEVFQKFEQDYHVRIVAPLEKLERDRQRDQQQRQAVIDKRRVQVQTVLTSLDKYKSKAV